MRYVRRVFLKSPSYPSRMIDEFEINLFRPTVLREIRFRPNLSLIEKKMKFFFS